MNNMLEVCPSRSVQVDCPIDVFLQRNLLILVDTITAKRFLENNIHRAARRVISLVAGAEVDLDVVRVAHTG